MQPKVWVWLPLIIENRPELFCIALCDANTQEIKFIKSIKIWNDFVKIDKKSIFLVYNSTKQLHKCLLSGVALPDNIVDLYIEYCLLNNGEITHKKMEPYLVPELLGFRNCPLHRLLRCISGLSNRKLDEITDDLIGDVLTLFVNIWMQLRSCLDIKYAVLRGYYLKVEASITNTGVPIDRELLLQLKTSKQNAWHSNDLQAIFNRIAIGKISIDAGDRNKTISQPFYTITGRTQQDSTHGIMESASWLRSLIVAPKNHSLALLDWSQQEPAVASVLSGDSNMQNRFFNGGDGYIYFGEQVGLISHNVASEESNVRDQSKTAFISILYGIGAKALANKLGCSIEYSREIIAKHQKMFPDYWFWRDDILAESCREQELRSVLGWRFKTKNISNCGTLLNFPIQANGADMMRLAAIQAQSLGVKICAIQHDSFLVEAPTKEIDKCIALMKHSMDYASKAILNGFILRISIKRFDHPMHLTAPKSQSIWNQIVKNDSLSLRCNAGDALVSHRRTPA